jgi:hypothetical protein
MLIDNSSPIVANFGLAGINFALTFDELTHVEQLNVNPKKNMSDTWFKGASVIVVYNHHYRRIISMVAIGGYEGGLADGTCVGDPICDIESKGWVLVPKRDGWINSDFPGVTIQNEYDDFPDDSDRGKGLVHRIQVSPTDLFPIPLD